MGRVGNISSDLHREARGSRVRPARIPKEVATDKPKRRSSFPRSPGKTAARTKLTEEPLVIEEFASVWEALGYSAQEAANLNARAELILQIREIVQRNGWTQVEAAKRCGVSQPRMNDLLRGKIDKFSIDALINIATALDHRVNFKLEAA